MKRRKAELTEQLTKTQQELKTEKEAHEQTKNTQPSFLKTLATYGFLPSVLGNLLL
ncbi:24414_t:CDS:1, partial [Racocetra persica]